MRRLFTLHLIFAVSFIAGPVLLQAQTYNMTNGTIVTCSGTFYDNGGNLATYSSNANITETFTSSTGTCLILTFNSFLTQAGNDILTIYDGPNTGSPVLGNFSGNTSPGTIISSTSSITFKFTSNATNNKAGWSATIACASCGTSYLLNSNATIDACDGLFYDSGGSGGSYSNNENYTQTFCSNLSDCIQFDFYSFNLAVGDTLKVYNGSSTSSSLIDAYSGATLPPALLSSGGCLTFELNTTSSGVSTGWVAAITCTVCPSPPGASADYLQTTVNLANSYLGGPMIATCGGTFTDDGNIASNYANNVSQIYETWCPSQVSHCLRTQFYSVHLKTGDKLDIRNGPTMESAAFPSGSVLTNTSCSTYEECLAMGYGPYLSTDQSGCITFIFNSNGTPNDSGWIATFDCVPCTYGPNGLDNSDCTYITPLCDNTGFSDASTGPGIVGDVTDNCLITETYSNWYSILMSSGGTLAMTIDPILNSDDYDWALFGPNVSCGNLGNPIRCSTATVVGSPNGNTGINTASNLSTNTFACGFGNSGPDFNEDACGNGWVNDLNVSTGQTYYLCVSKWSAGGSGFDLTWNMSSGATIDCSVLPIVLTSFDCNVQGNMITLSWTTASELNNDYFIIEKSSDGEQYETLATVPGKAFTSLPSQYFMADTHPFAGNNYYRLKQVDLDGDVHELKTTSCEFNNNNEEVLLEVFDLSGRMLYSEIILQSDFQYVMHSLSLSTGVYVTALIYKNGMADVSKFLKGE